MIRITHVLCPVDFSEISQHALNHAAAIASWYEARLSLLYVFVNLPAIDLPPLPFDGSERKRVVTLMRSMAERVSAKGGVDSLVQEAPYVHEEILAQQAATDADLLVLGTHGRSGFERVFLGSVTEKVIRKATCPTLVVPPRATDVAPDAPVQFHRILCAVDFSTSSLNALTHAIDLAQESDAHLTVMHVIEVPPEFAVKTPGDEINLDHIRAAAEAEAGRRLRDLIPSDARNYCTVHTSVVEGRAYRELLRAAAEQSSDLIVMGVHGRGALDLLVFGSTTHHVIRAAVCPVLVVRGE